jgi:hypothetical protein
MEYNLDDYEKRLLKQMYGSYDDWLRKNNRMKSDSVLYSIIRTTRASRSKLFRETAEKYIDPSTANSLIEVGLIRESDDRRSYAFTMNGLFYTETILLENGNFFKESDKYFFNVFEDVSITDRERIILITMVALRTFSEKSAIDMKESVGVQDEWWEILKRISDLLVEEKVVNEKTSLSSYTSSKIEHSASDVIRHSENLPPATKNVFIKPGNNLYYLDLIENGRIKTNVLADLLELVFEGRGDDYTVDRISYEMRSFPRLHGIAVQSYMDENFFSSAYDDEISQAFDLLKINLTRNEIESDLKTE